MDNRTRAEHGGSILDSMEEWSGNDSHDQLVDLLTDLMHHCNMRSDLSFNDCLEVARHHFETEIEEDDE
jgi:hypothetical protein